MTYTFKLSHGVERGDIDASLQGRGGKGYQGVPARTSVGPDGLTNIKDNPDGHQLRPPANYEHFHDPGAFLIMNEQLARTNQQLRPQRSLFGMTPSHTAEAAP